MPWWGWIILGLVVLLGEVIAATDFYLVFFAAGALVTGLLGLFGIPSPAYGQWLLFASLSIIALLLFRTKLREKIQTREAHVDNIQGESILATERIPRGETARAELRGSSWSARNVGDVDIEAGDRCRVDEVNGLVLSVRKESES